MKLYRKSIIGELKQQFDETGTILKQYLDEIRAEYFIIDTEFSNARCVDQDELPVSLEETSPILVGSAGVQQQTRIYRINMPIEVWQLFDEKGKFLGQKFQCIYEVYEDVFDLCNDGIDNVCGPYCYVENWNGRKMKPTNVEEDETLPFPHFPLPFTYEVKAEFVQPEKLSLKKKRLVKKYL
jgi:hypothetical protein